MKVDDFPDMPGVAVPDEPQESAPHKSFFTPGNIVLMLGLTLVVIVVGMQLMSQQQSRPLSGPAPEFNVTSFDGVNYDLAQMRGEIVIVNFWGSWCGPCRDEAPILEQLHRDYADRGVTLLGITYLDDEDNSLRFMEEYNMTFPSAPDPSLAAADAYHITGAPETYVIDRDGNIVEDYVFIGPITEISVQRLRNRLDELIAENS